MSDPYAAPQGLGPDAPVAPVASDGSEGQGTSLAQRLLPEVRLGAGVVLACLLVGLVMAGLWAWLAPKVPLVVDGDRILYVDPEGEQRAGADAVFVLIGLGAGILTALGAFLVTRRRGGGIAVALGLAVGGLLGSMGAWRIGRWLGPSNDLIGEARRVGNGGHFDASIDLGALGALLVWPMAAMVVLLAVSAAFGKREEDPPPYWGVPAGQAPVGPQVEPGPGPEGGSGH
ncbi:hypothetical protein BX285_2870 [Streptomyces sp. 1114.5]|uniref:hypothetical protein n=1 Tax=unclassified Streptomyces TaxID=2593676 RepID=UPI000BD4C7ED|nr:MULTISPECIES: hypothetical protein [unclassified Streptomyces]RKT18447.1 hypothetical protein BX285_2870 [Streptomyces sp. 1114.5]SOB84644.1 hypothetical protein SAMN06272789_4901 [Streptomyces sp. 1331.2]